MRKAVEASNLGGSFDVLGGRGGLEDLINARSVSFHL